MYIQHVSQPPLGVAEDGIEGQAPRVIWDTIAPDGDADPWNVAALGSIYVRSAASNVRVYVKAAANDADADWVLLAHGAQEASISDVAVTATLSGVDTGTDMTAAQAATIVTDLTNLAAAVNDILDALDAFGVTA